MLWQQYLKIMQHWKCVQQKRSNGFSLIELKNMKKIALTLAKVAFQAKDATLSLKRQSSRKTPSKKYLKQVQASVINLKWLETQKSLIFKTLTRNYAKKKRPKIIIIKEFQNRSLGLASHYAHQTWQCHKVLNCMKSRLSIVPKQFTNQLKIKLTKLRTVMS